MADKMGYFQGVRTHEWVFDRRDNETKCIKCGVLDYNSSRPCKPIENKDVKTDN